MSESITEEIPAALDNERIDRVVALIGDVTRAAASEMVSSGAVMLDETSVAKSSHKVKVGQVVSFTIPAAEIVTIKPQENIEFEVIYEDDNVIVVNKPAGLVVHPGAGISGGTLVNGLIARYPELSEVGEAHRPGIVHRLDSGTTGLLVVARSETAYESLVNQLSSHDAQRGYVAIVHGKMESDAGTIDAPIGRSSRDRTKMGVAVGGKQARTHYVTTQRFNEPAQYSLVDLELETGRTHQIRVHLSAIGHPVLGDETYGGAKGPVVINRPLLHAARLSFTNPTTGETGEFNCAPPADFGEILSELQKKDEE